MPSSAAPDGGSRRFSERTAVPMLAFVCVVWGFSFVCIKEIDRVLAEEAGLSFAAAAAWTTTVRFLLAFGVLAALPAVRRGLSPGVLRDGLVVAIPSALGYGLQAAGMRGLEPGANAFLTSLYTPLTPVVAWLVFRKPPPARIAAAVPIAVLGAAVLAAAEEDGSFQWLGGFGTSEALVTAGAVCWAFQILLIDRLGPRHDAAPLAAALFLFTGLLGAIALVPAGLTGGFPPLASALALPGLRLPMAGLVLLSTVLTLFLMIRYQPRIDPSRAALLYVLEPAFAAIFAVILTKEAFGGWKLAGCLILFLANVFVEIRPRRRANAVTSP